MREHREQHDRRVDRDQRDRERHEQQLRVAHALARGAVLEAAVGKLAHHQDRSQQRDREGEHQAGKPGHVVLVRERDEGGHDRGPRRARQALEIALVLGRRARVESGEAQRSRRPRRRMPQSSRSATRPRRTPRCARRPTGSRRPPGRGRTRPCPRGCRIPCRRRFPCPSAAPPDRRGRRRSWPRTRRGRPARSCRRSRRRSRRTRRTGSRSSAGSAAGRCRGACVFRSGRLSCG